MFINISKLAQAPCTSLHKQTINNHTFSKFNTHHEVLVIVLQDYLHTLPLAVFTAQQYQTLTKAQETPQAQLYYPAWQRNVCRGNRCKALCEHERRGGNELLVMPRNRKDPSNQYIPPAPDIPRCSLRCRGKHSTVPPAKGTPARGRAAPSKHLLPPGIGSSQRPPPLPRRQKSPFMTPDDVICGRRRVHSSTGLCISNKPIKKPA